MQDLGRTLSSPDWEGLEMETKEMISTLAVFDRTHLGALQPSPSVSHITMPEWLEGNRKMKIFTLLISKGKYANVEDLLSQDHTFLS